MIPIKLYKKFFSFLVYIKMDQKNIMFFENDDKSQTIIDLYPNHRFLGYKDSYNYHDIDVDQILLFKKGDKNILLDIRM